MPYLWNRTSQAPTLWVVRHTTRRTERRATHGRTPYATPYEHRMRYCTAHPSSGPAPRAYDVSTIEPLHIGLSAERTRLYCRQTPLKAGSRPRAKHKAKQIPAAHQTKSSIRSSYHKLARRMRLYNRIAILEALARYHTGVWLPAELSVVTSTVTRLNLGLFFLSLKP